MTASPRTARQTKTARTTPNPKQPDPEPLATEPPAPEPPVPSEWQVRLRQGLSAVTLAIVVLAPETVAWQPILGFAHNVLHVEGWKAYLVPLCAGAAAFYFALLTMNDVLKGDSALANRLATWLYAAGGASASVYYELTAPSGTPAGGVFYGAASLSAAWVWDRTLKAWRRNELRALGALEKPLPRFRLLRWVMAPRQTFAAFRQSVLLGLSTAEDAVAAAARARFDKLVKPTDHRVRDVALMLLANPQLDGKDVCEALGLDTTERSGRRLLEQARELLRELNSGNETRPELEIARQQAS